MDQTLPPIDLEQPVSPTGNTASIPSYEILSPSHIPQNAVIYSGHVTQHINADDCAVECSPGFYCTMNNTCRPLCDSWNKASREILPIGDIAVIAAISTAFLTGIIVFIIIALQGKTL